MKQKHHSAPSASSSSGAFSCAGVSEFGLNVALKLRPSTATDAVLLTIGAKFSQRKAEGSRLAASGISAIALSFVLAQPNS